MARAKKEGQFLNTKLPQDIFDKVTEYSDRTRIPKTAVVEMALREYMDKVSPAGKTKSKTGKLQ